MKKLWWCVSCSERVALDTHGRCGVCDSDAVAWIGSQILAWQGIIPEVPKQVQVVVPTLLRIGH